MRAACPIFVVLLLLVSYMPALAQEKAHGRLFVETNVEQAVISILNHELTFLQGMPLSPGMYVVQVAAEGYPTKTKTVKVAAGKDVRLRVNLDKDEQTSQAPQPEVQKGPFHEERGKGRGRLYVKPTPPDATIRILNIAPKFEQGMELGPGTYKLEVKKDGVGEIIKNVDVRKNEDLTVTVNLAPDAEAADNTAAQETKDKPGRLFVKTSPSDATIKLLGIKPKFKQGIKLEPGEYRIEVSSEGYQKSELQAEIFADKDTRVSINLISETPEPEAFPPTQLADAKTVTAPAKKAKERLYVVTMPEDADIRILNIVPKFKQGIEVGDGEFEVEVSHDDFETQVRMITVPKDKHLAVGFDLRPPEQRLREQADLESGSETPDISDPGKGQLFVETDVEDASVRLMDLKQPFEQGMELAPGSYRIEVFKQGVGRKEAMALVSSGKASHVRVQLTPAPATQEEVQREEMVQRRNELMQQALAAERGKDLERALELVNKVLELDPRHGAAYTLRGNLRFAQGKYNEALEDYNLSLELAPSAPSPWLARGKVHAVLDDAQSACYDFWRACALKRCEGIASAQQEGLCR